MARDEFSRRLSALSKQLGVDLQEEQLQQFYSYYTLLVEKNKVMNLTAITEEEDVIVKHFIDSLAMVKLNVSRETFSKWIEGRRCMDVGTGAGFPGLAIKIAFPSISLSLSDSLQKRIHFLEEVVRELGLKGVDFYHGRAGEGKEGYSSSGRKAGRSSGIYSSGNGYRSFSAPCSKNRKYGKKISEEGRRAKQGTFGLNFQES